MRLTQLRFPLCGLLFIALGCAPTFVPATRKTFYHAPADTGAVVAILRGVDGTVVREIDQTVVANSDTANGGNTVRVVPGRHRLRVISIGVAGSSDHLFEMDLEPGKTYELRRKSDDCTNLLILDPLTGREVMTI